jgi:N-acetylglutamate synthase-like GNAT family acetyltransferase
MPTRREQAAQAVIEQAQVLARQWIEQEGFNVVEMDKLVEAVRAYVNNTAPERDPNAMEWRGGSI